MRLTHRVLTHLIAAPWRQQPLLHPPARRLTSLGGTTMFRIPLGRTPRYCDGVSRRSFLQIGVAGMGAISLGQMLAMREASAAATGAKKDTSVILLWLDGGPGHMDMYDMKPEAPPEYRGIWRPIKTNVSGIEITELFPL